ncbi:MAG: ferrochelatase [Nitrospirota bacterium]
MPNNTAILLISLGGPRSLNEVGPFMTAFIGKPVPPSVVSAIAERYKLIGGKSPLPEIVKAQAEALEKKLAGKCCVYEGFVCSHPTVEESFQKALKEEATHVIGLSMSPFETTVMTSRYRDAFESAGVAIRKTFIPSWHNNHFFIRAWQEKITEGLERFSHEDRKQCVVIFTSHSIPLRYITSGDPYQKQIEETIKLVAEGLGLKKWRIAWQSKGAQANEPWLEPEVETVMDKIAQEGHKAVLEVPIGFTCDHLETLYDIDIVHRAHAEKLGLRFNRAESLNTSTTFIKGLANVVLKKIE